MKFVGNVYHRTTGEQRDLLDLGGGVRVARNPNTGRADRYVSGGEWSRTDRQSQSVSPTQHVAPTPRTERRASSTRSPSFSGSGSVITNAYIRNGAQMSHAMHVLQERLPTEMHRVERYIESVALTPERALEVAVNLGRYSARTLDTLLRIAGFR